MDLFPRLWPEGSCLPSLCHFLPIVPSSLCTSIVPSSLTLCCSECCYHACDSSIIRRPWAKHISKPHVALLSGSPIRNLSCNRLFRCFWHLAHFSGPLLQTWSPSMSSSSFTPAGVTVWATPPADFQNTDLSLFRFQLKDSMFKAP